MRVIPKLISTTFLQEVNESEQEKLLTSGKEILLSRGLIETKRLKEKLKFRPRFMQHYAYSPYSFFLGASLEIRKNTFGKYILRYTVVHPFHIIIYSLFYLFLQFDFNKPVFYIPLLLIASHTSWIFFVQYPIFKKIIKQRTNNP